MVVRKKSSRPSSRRKPAARPKKRRSLTKPKKRAPFHTAFITECVEFIKTDPRIGFSGHEDTVDAVPKFGAIATTLLMICEENGVRPGPPPADPVAAALTGFLIAQDWPATASPNPAGWESVEDRTARRAEVSLILDRLIELVNGGPGGGGEEWPPRPRN
jgi:hypothetical protein